MSGKSLMHAAGESQGCVVPTKVPNNGPGGSAEGLEGRRPDKENSEGCNPSRTQSREVGSRGLPGVREAAKKDQGSINTHNHKGTRIQDCGERREP